MRSALPSAGWPSAATDRDRVVLSLRTDRPAHDPWRYQHAFLEDERTARGSIARTAAILLTGRECRWRCAMCDLWRATTVEDTPAGAIPTQIAAALAALATDAGARPTQVKLYNASSFFDPSAVPESDYEDVGRLVGGFDRVIVESHPALVGPRVRRLSAALALAGSAQLEVAMGLETVHPDALERLHKRMSLDLFASAAGRLLSMGGSLRVFLLVYPPFVPEPEQDRWLLRSLQTAAACGATVVSLVPTRNGNGTVDRLQGEGLFMPPRLADVERSQAAALRAARGRLRVFVDLWDLSRTSTCDACFERRRSRLHAMNLEQLVRPPVSCPACGGTAGA